MTLISHPQVPIIGATFQIVDRQSIGDFDKSGDWTVLNDDTANPGNSNNHILGSLSLEFDKVDGSTNGTTAMMDSTIAEIDLRRFTQDARILSALYISSVSKIVSAFIKLGTDSSNYNLWSFPVSGLVAGVWNELSKKLSETEQSVTGTGINLAAVTYIAVGATFGAEADVLANMRWDNVHIVS